MHNNIKLYYLKKYHDAILDQTDYHFAQLWI